LPALAKADVGEKKEIKENRIYMWVALLRIGSGFLIPLVNLIYVIPTGYGTGGRVKPTFSAPPFLRSTVPPSLEPICSDAMSACC